MPIIRAAVRLIGPEGKSVDSSLYEGDDIARIAAEVNYRLRVEVAPHWPPNTLRMEVDTAAPSSYTREALRHMLQGVAIAWRMAPSLDPEDTTTTATE